MSETIHDWLFERELEKQRFIHSLAGLNAQRAEYGMPPVYEDGRPLPTPLPRPPSVQGSEVLRHEIEWPTRSAVPMWRWIVPLVLLAFGIGMLAGLLLARVAPL